MYGGISYWIMVIVCFAIGALAQGYINRMYKMWSRVDAAGSKTGAEMARDMLESAGAHAVKITTSKGHLSDHFDIRDNSLHLSEENYSKGSVASIAVACHEAGHAIQTAKGYLPGRIRVALVPIVNFSQQTWLLVLIFGIFFRSLGFIQLAIALFAFSVVFHLVTLPVEIDASRRALAYISKSGSGLDKRGARQVLTAAALTYVAAALTSVIQLLYLIGQTDRR